MYDIVFKLLTLAPPILMALTVHEASHGWAANRLGDPTAKMLGRITLNPIRHLDLTGTLVFFVTAWMGSGFGWAKPVPINPRNFKNPSRDTMWVSLAGPASNLIFAAVLSVFMQMLYLTGVFPTDSIFIAYLGRMLQTGVFINVILAFFNLIPLPPLDGSGILAGLLPFRAAMKYREISSYGMFILLGLIVLPSWVPGFPNIIGYLVVRPAYAVGKWMLLLGG